MRNIIFIISFAIISTKLFAADIKNIFEDYPFSIAVLTESDVAECADFLSHNFAQGEPMARHLEMRPEDFRDIFYSVVEEAAKTGASVVLRKKENNRVIGCTARIDLVDDYKTDLKLPTFNLNATYDILKKVSSPLKDTLPLERGVYLQASLGGIAQEFQGQGCHKIMHQAGICLAALKGFKYIIAETTGKVSTSNAIKVGFKMLHNIEYETFNYQGHYPFKNLEGGVTLVICVLNAPKL